MENASNIILEKGNIKLETKTVYEIAQMHITFRVPSYQRGYRWGKNEVERLLNDIFENKDDNYCLQPIIVNKYDDIKYYDLIDGQQRLTTLYLIYKVMHKYGIEFSKFDKDAPAKYPKTKFEICYQNESRNGVKDFLENIDLKTEEESKDYIDYYCMYKAYKTIDEWFGQNTIDKMNELSKAFNNKVTLIWYEPQENSGKSPEKLFTDINAGKIKLTCSELLKAVFYQKEEEKYSLKPEEIAFQWDEIERELHDEAFWSFLTNESGDNYPTRIDIILDLVAKVKKEDKEKDELISFFELQNKLKEYRDLEKNKSPKSKLWEELIDTFLLLRDWYNDKDFYNKIGYLITTEEKTLLDILETYKNNSTDRKTFNDKLDEFIRNSLNDNKTEYVDWDYKHHRNKIQNLMLLFNVLSVGKFKERKLFNNNGEGNLNKEECINKEKFPFDKYKIKTQDKKKREKIFWSLEHINPQEKPNFSINEDKVKWIKNQVKLFELLIKDDNESNKKDNELLLQEIKTVTEKSNNLKDIFEKLINQIERLLKFDYDDAKDNIENLALLCTHQNAALSNSFFYSKRQKIIEMDKNGEYIPFCTKMAFYKYYTDNASDNIKWNKKDMSDYLKEIYCILGDYLPDKGEALKEKINGFKRDMGN